MSDSFDIFPYPVAREVASVQLTLDLENTEVALVNGVVDLTAQAPGARLDIGVHVVVAEDALQRVLPKAEWPAPPVRAMVLVEGDPSRRRTAIALDADRDPRSFTARWQLDVGEWFGDVNLRPVIVRARNGASDAFADRNGALIAEGAEVVLRFDANEPPVGNTLDVRFVDFRDHPPLGVDVSDLYAIDFQAEPPVILLNSAIDDFATIMKSKARTGYNARIRNGLYPSIALPVWTTLVGVALARFIGFLDNDGDWKSGDVDWHPAFEDLAQWEQSVIRFIAPRLYETSTDDSIDSLVAALAADQGAEVYSRMNGELQQWLRTRRGYDDLLAVRDGVNV